MGMTEIGKYLRKLRIDTNERLINMARRIERSAAFVSAVETGKKSPPLGFEDRIVKSYGLSKDAANELRKAADRSRKAFTIETNSPLARDTAGLMARRIDSLSNRDLNEILAILTKKGDRE